MRTGRAIATWMVALGCVALFAGCGPDSKDMQIQKLQEDKNRLQAENADLQSRLASAMQDAQRSRDRALQLQQMLDDARRQIAERGSAPNLPPGWEGTETFAWTEIQEDILFDSGKAELKATGRTKLREAAQTIQTTPEFLGREVWVIGHTDNDPIRVTKNLWKDNLDLSCNRAMTVVRELRALGLDPQRLVAAGQGEYKPKAPNTSKANKALNRRVQIVTVQMPVTTGGSTTPTVSEESSGAPAETGSRG